MKFALRVSQMSCDGCECLVEGAVTSALSPLVLGVDDPDDFSPGGADGAKNLLAARCPFLSRNESVCDVYVGGMNGRAFDLLLDSLGAGGEGEGEGDLLSQLVEAACEGLDDMGFAGELLPDEEAVAALRERVAAAEKALEDKQRLAAEKREAQKQERERAAAAAAAAAAATGPADDFNPFVSVGKGELRDDNGALSPPQALFGSDAGGGQPTEEMCQMSVSGMTCAACVGNIERYLGKQPGVINVSVGLLAESADVTFDPSVTSAEEIREHIIDTGYKAELKAASGTASVRLALSGGTAQAADTARLALEANVGVLDVTFGGGAETTPAGIIVVSYDPLKVGPRDVIDIITHAGLSAQLAPEDQVWRSNKAKNLWVLKRDLFIAVLLGVPVFLVGMVFMNFGDPLVRNIFLAVMTTPVQFYCGRRFYKGAFKMLKIRSSNMDTLVVLGTSAAYFYSVGVLVTGGTDVFFDTSAMLIMFILAGKYFEGRAKHQTSEAIEKLVQLQPTQAVLVTHDSGGTERERIIDAALIQRGDILKVVPGARIPVDGEVAEGRSEVDTSIITGEFKPRPVEEGTEVIGGTVNGSGLLRVRAIRVGADTGLAQIIRLVQNAQTDKAPIQSYADKISSVFVPVVVTLALVTLTGWLIAGQDFAFALKLCISVIVIACPCALGLATPTAMMVGTGKGAELGVLIKGGSVLETAHDVTAVLFDKTGTLTEGKPSVGAFQVFATGLSQFSGRFSSLTEDEEQFWYYAGSAETGSEHPLAHGLVEFARRVLVSSNLELTDPQNLNNSAGSGIACEVNRFDGKGKASVSVGSLKFMQESHGNTFAGYLDARDVQNVMDQLSQDSPTSFVFVAVDGVCIGVIGFNDAIRREATATVAALQRLGIQSWMITGDNKASADRVAAEVGIRSDHVFAEVLPNQKAKKVAALQERKHIVTMVGDGINDSPALAAADVGMAIGAGTDVAIEAADVVLVKSDLREIVTAIDLSRKTFSRIKINYVWAMCYNMLGIPLAAGLFYSCCDIPTIPPMAAGLAMAFSSVSVVASSLWLKRYKKPELWLPGDEVPKNATTEWSFVRVLRRALFGRDSYRPLSSV